ncbi:hypothetical protein ACFOEM_13720 [Paenalcaligenes hominis]|uniref:hypothetical protein n=1 Tax=Paenalcaligenes hominis TaxID=643674 RepID=UPI0036065C87
MVRSLLLEAAPFMGSLGSARFTSLRCVLSRSPKNASVLADLAAGAQLVICVHAESYIVSMSHKLHRY